MLEPALRGMTDERGIKVGDLFTPLRVAITGSTASPPLFETMAVLGPIRTLTRIDSAVARLHVLDADRGSSSTPVAD